MPRNGRLRSRKGRRYRRASECGGHKPDSERALPVKVVLESTVRDVRFFLPPCRKYAGASAPGTASPPTMNPPEHDPQLPGGAERPGMSDERREKPTSVFAVLLEARDLVEAGDPPFGDEAKHIINKVFSPIAWKWRERARVVDGAQRIEDDTQNADVSTARLQADRNVEDNRLRCWEWVSKPQGKDKLPPWQKCLIVIERGDSASFETRAICYLREGANRHLHSQLNRNSPRKILLEWIGKALRELRYESVDGAKSGADRCFRPSDHPKLQPDPNIDLAALSERMGAKRPRGTSKLTLVLLPNASQLREMIGSAYVTAQRALTVGQLLELAVLVFELTLREPVKIHVEGEGTGQSDNEFGVETISLSDEPLHPNFEVFSSINLEPFDVIEHFATRLIDDLEVHDGSHVVDQITKSGRRDWLGTLCVRYYLWADWELWNAQHEPVHGRTGRPIRYGYVKAGELLGKATATVQEAIEGKKDEAGKLAFALENARETIGAEECGVLDAVLRSACEKAEEKFGGRKNRLTEALERGEMNAKEFIFVLGSVLGTLPRNLARRVENQLRDGYESAASQEKKGRFQIILDDVFGDLPLVERERVEDLLRCRYFHCKPEFVNPGRFVPEEILKNIQ